MQSQLPNIYNYDDPHRYLIDVLNIKKEQNPRFSVRGWSQNMGLKHHGLLSMALNKKRPLKAPLTSAIKRYLNLEKRAARYFDLLIKYKNADNQDDKEFYLEIIEEMQPNENNEMTLKLDFFKTISDWHHIAILEMVGLKGFVNNPDWMAEKLGKKISPQAIEQAIARLIRLELLVDCGGVLKKTHSQIFTETDIPDESLRKFNRQMIRFSEQSLENTEVQKREISSYVMPVDISKIPEAKIAIKSFYKKLSQIVEKSQGDEVYCFATQFFPLTEKGS